MDGLFILVFQRDPAFTSLIADETKMSCELLAVRIAQFAEKRLDLEWKLPVDREHGEKQFSDETFLIRPWYHERAPRPRDPNELLYDEKTLPPTSRLGWIDGSLTDIPKEQKGRCPTCGHLVFLPCLACRVRRDMATKTIATPQEHDDAEDGDEREPDLLFR